MNRICCRRQTQALPSQPPEGAAEEVRAGDAAAPSLDPSRIPVNSNSFDDVQSRWWPRNRSQAAAETAAATAGLDANAPPQPQQQQPPQQQAALPAPTGQSLMWLAGRVENADKVNEIVGKLAGLGFQGPYVAFDAGTG